MTPIIITIRGERGSGIRTVSDKFTHSIDNALSPKQREILHRSSYIGGISTTGNNGCRSVIALDEVRRVTLTKGSNKVATVLTRDIYLLRRDSGAYYTNNFGEIVQIRNTARKS